MLNTYIVEGGIGKCVAFSAIIDALVERDGGQIQVYTPYHEVFGGNPNVKWVFDMNSMPLQDERIVSSDNIHFCEPYKSNFIKGHEHLIQSYCKLLGVKYSKKMRPKLYTDHAKEQADELLEKAEITGDYMVVQFTGGQPPAGWNPQNPYGSADPARNYPHWMAQQVVNQLKQDKPDRTIIHFGLPNEPRYEGTVMLEASFPMWHEILKDAEGFIGIDSSLQHMSASAKTEGVVIWGSTRFNQFGYSENTNVNFHMEDTWDETKFNGADPRNAMVDPAKVVQLYMEKTK